jgi:hypothetical protein
MTEFMFALTHALLIVGMIGIMSPKKFDNEGNRIHQNRTFLFTFGGFILLIVGVVVGGAMSLQGLGSQIWWQALTLPIGIIVAFAVRHPLAKASLRRFRQREKDRKNGVAAARAQEDSIFLPPTPPADVFEPAPTARTPYGQPVFEAVLAETGS